MDIRLPTQISAERAGEIHRVLDVARRFGSHDTLAGASTVLIDALGRFIKADRVHLLFYASEGHCLWTEPGDTWETARELPSTDGIAGLVIQTSQTVNVEHAATVSCYHRETDDPEGSGQERILALPLIGTNDKIHGVLIAVRLAGRIPFSKEEVRIGELLTKHLRTQTSQLAMQQDVDSALKDQRGDQIFRRQAAIAHAESGQQGHVIRVSGQWLNRTYWLLLLALICGATFSFFAQISIYSSGTAIVVQLGRVDISAPISGSVETVTVRPGDRITAGQPLVTFSSPSERAQFVRLEHEWKTAIRSYLGDRDGHDTGDAISSLRLKRNQLLDRLTVRATRSGIVGDIRVTPGQYKTEGDPLLSIVQDEKKLQVLVFLPGADRPKLYPGMPIRITLHGYPHNYIEATIESVGDIAGPSDTRRTLGRQLLESVPLPASVVIVRASLPGQHFEIDDNLYQLSHGMTGAAEILTGTETVAKTLLPGGRQ